MATKRDSMEAIKQIYAEMLRIDNSDEREANGFPRTKELFAEKYHVSRQTLWRWEQDPDFKRRMADQGLGILTTSDFAKIMLVAKNKAMSGSLGHMKFVCEMAGLYGRNRVITPFEHQADNIQNFADMSEKELEEYLERIELEDAEQEKECKTIQ